ncbi:MAG: FAD-dependent oxidoreductase [Candidatus Obscuribacterales bacterium]
MPMLMKETTRSCAAQVERDGTRIFEVVDVQNVQAEDPGAGIKKYSLTGKPKVRNFQVVVAGGGMGGVAAAIRAAQAGLTVAIAEETDWLGGQMTAQGVSAPDENPWIETSGGTQLYLELREELRAYYRQFLKEKTGPAAERLNAGDCWVSRVSFEANQGLAALTKLIERHAPKGKITILPRAKVVEAKLKGRRATAVLVVNLDSGKFTELRCRFLIDATELGDLLPLLAVAYASGAESRQETGEAHAPETANPQNVQDFTYPFILEWCPDSKTQNVIPQPPHYEDFERSGKFSLLGYKMFENHADKKPDGTTRNLLPFWSYRRLVAADKFTGNKWPGDIAMINWEAHDLRGENIIDQTNQDTARRLALGKALSLGFLYWLQTRAPRDEGGEGYPEMKLRPDLLGTTDGLSKYPYIRESRRIKALSTIKEEDVVTASATTGDARARHAVDAIGIGHYPIDIHGHQDVPGAAQPVRPFQIPLSAMIQRPLTNFLPACKNIGTTHVTNGAYRLHPVEWAIGEAAGIVAAYCLQHRTTPEQILKNRKKLRTVQNQLLAAGAPIFWFADVPVTHPQFAAIQFLSQTGLWSARPDSLDFQPESLIDQAEAEAILRRIAGDQAKSKVHDQKLTRAAFAELAYQEALRPTRFGRA